MPLTVGKVETKGCQGAASLQGAGAADAELSTGQRPLGAVNTTLCSSNVTHGRVRAAGAGTVICPEDAAEVQKGAALP